MNHRQFANCCAAVEIGSFSGYTQGQVANYLQARIREGKQENKAFLVATTTKHQQSANAALKAAGFRSTNWGDRRGSNSLKFWIYDLTGTAIPARRKAA